MFVWRNNGSPLASYISLPPKQSGSAAMKGVLSRCYEAQRQFREKPEITPRMKSQLNPDGNMNCQIISLRGYDSVIGV